jgi:HSP20 family protein
LRREFGQLQFKQLLRLPENVKRDDISATVTNGILHIVLPKYTEAEKRAMGKSIEIK